MSVLHPNHRLGPPGVYTLGATGEKITVAITYGKGDAKKYFAAVEYPDGKFVSGPVGNVKLRGNNEGYPALNILDFEGNVVLSGMVTELRPLTMRAEIKARFRNATRKTHWNFQQKPPIKPPAR